MKRWIVALIAVLIACLPILINRAQGPGLLQDSDTAVLLDAIRYRADPMSWFRGDWPLQNHFYRPISTLAFEMDNKLYGNNAAGYGLTNALLCVTCVLTLFWFLRELTKSPTSSALGAILFALWHFASFPYWALDLLGWFTWLTLIVGLIRHGKQVRQYVPAFFILLFFSSELSGIKLLYSRMIAWLPGRTASVMTVFALAALAAYARSERLKGLALVKDEVPSPLTPPATRSTKVAEAPRAGWPWAIASVLFTALALGSYEQAVMLPACILAVAMTMRCMGYKPSWAWQGAFWGLLIGYLALRYEILPHTSSAYQKQQLRYGAGVLLDLSAYVFPAVGSWPSLSVMSGFLVFFTDAPYRLAMLWATNIVGFYQLRREWILGLAGWGMSSLAFLPMAWVKLFEHYHYWPMALRTIFVLAIGKVAIQLVATAWCPPTLQAPPRSVPAPGSLPRL